MRTRQLHVLIVDVAVGVDVIAEVTVIGDLTQLSLNVTYVAISDVTIAIYVADIIYRSDAIKMHIDLLAGTRASRPAAGRQRPAKPSSRAQGGAPTTRVRRGCN